MKRVVVQTANISKLPLDMNERRMEKKKRKVFSKNIRRLMSKIFSKDISRQEINMVGKRTRAHLHTDNHHYKPKVR